MGNMRLLIDLIFKKDGNIQLTDKLSRDKIIWRTLIRKVLLLPILMILSQPILVEKVGISRSKITSLCFHKKYLLLAI